MLTAQIASLALLSPNSVTLSIEYREEFSGPENPYALVLAKIEEMAVTADNVISVALDGTRNEDVVARVRQDDSYHISDRDQRSILPKVINEAGNVARCPTVQLLDTRIQERLLHLAKNGV